MLLDPFSRALSRGALDRLVEVDEFQLHCLCEFLPDRRLPSAHISDEDQLVSHGRQFNSKSVQRRLNERIFAALKPIR